jgi:hypothetical protein
MKFHITPHTKIADLLNTYPEIEDFLITLVPTFSKLKNPILRNTIGKLATIEQAAKVGEVPMPFLINALNEKLGLVPDAVMNPIDINVDKFLIQKNNIVQIISADEIISSGGSPVSVVLGGLRKLEDEQILQLDCSFHPAPLIDKAKDAGYKAYETRNDDMTYSIFFKK